MNKILLFAGCLLWCMAGTAQDLHYNFYNYSTENGVQTDYYQNIFQDSYGFLWLASYDGLFKWDGYTFKKYAHDEKDSTSLADNIVYTIFEDSRHQLWVGTIGGLDLYDRQTDGFTLCPLTTGKEKIPVNAIVEDGLHQLWLGTSSGLCKYQGYKKNPEWVFNQSDDYIIFCLTVDPENNLWAGTFNQGIVKYNQSDHSIRHFVVQKEDPAALSSNKISSIMADREGHIWAGTNDNGIDILDLGGKVSRRYSDFAREGALAPHVITCLYEDRNGIVWIGMRRGGTYYFRKSDPAPVALGTPASNNNHEKLLSIASIREDSFGNMWFASDGYGLFYTNSNKNLFKNYSIATKVGGDTKKEAISCFYEDARGRIWLGTNGGGLLEFDPGRDGKRGGMADRKKQGAAAGATDGPIRRIPAPGNLAINDIKGDEKGKLWISTWGAGLKTYDPATGRVESFVNNPADNNSIISNDITAILPEDSLVWLGTHGEGLTVYDKSGHRFIHHNNNSTLPFQMREPAWVNHLFRDSHKRLWISTYSGVYVLDQKKLSHFEHNPADPSSVSSNSVNMVTEDGKGQIWVISESGLDRYDQHSRGFVHMTSQYHLPEIMKGIVTSDDNTLWIGANRSIVSFNPGKGTVRIFDKNDGLQENNFLSKAVLKASNGDLYFGGPKGFDVFHPDSLRPVRVPVYFYFTNLYLYSELQQPGKAGSVLTKVLSATDTLRLSYRQAFFSVEFTAINLYAPQRTKYSYKLENLHDQWIDLKEERKISFTSLQPGSYTLKVRYTDGEGHWQPSPRDLHILILPAWWQTTWFKVLAALALVAVVMSAFYWRVASIKRRNRLLKAEVAHRTSELSEMNSFLTEQNDEIKLQKEKLEEWNEEMQRRSDKILEQQQHILSQNNVLENTVDELEKSNSTKDHFFSILAHDLKNPVSALAEISGFMKDHLVRMDRATLQEQMDSLHNSSAAVYELLVNLLNWSRSQSGKIEYQPMDCDLQDIVDKNVRLLEPQMNSKHLVCTVVTDPAHRVYGDYHMLDTVVRNLVANGVKFTGYNGKIRIVSEEENGYVLLSITDSGVGIPAEHLERLFSLTKTHIARGTAGEKGTGLGLVIAKEFIEINKGGISVKSDPGKGSTFTVRLPKARTEARAARGTAAAGTSGATGGTTARRIGRAGWNGHNAMAMNEPATPDLLATLPMEKLLKLKGKKVLIVDDNKELRDYLKLILSGIVEIFEAVDGQDGLKAAQAFPPEMIITDVLMPGMNGLQFCREIKTRTDTSHIPVIMLTSKWDENSKVSGYEAGADQYLTKPVKQELLVQVMLNLIRTQEIIHEKMMGKVLDGDPLVPEKGTINRLDEEFMNKLITFIEANIAEPNLDARILGKEMAVSRTVLYAKIKTLTGQTVHEFIKTIRLKRSLVFLLEGRLSISQVAGEVGFNSHSYFDRCFIKQYGMGPKEYVNDRRRGKG